MTITSALILFAITWFLTFYITLQIRTRTQAEAGHIVPGTPASAPAEENIGRSALIATGFAVAIWAILSWVITSEVITTEDLDFRGVLKDLDQDSTAPVSTPIPFVPKDSQ